MGRKIFLVLFVIAAVLGVATWRTRVSLLSFEKNAAVKTAIPLSQKTETPSAAVSKVEGNKSVKPKIEPKKAPQSILIENVPFTVQAPFGEWNNPIFQDGCEEAALAMAAYWLSGKSFSPDIAKQEIIALARFEEKKFGQAVDTSAVDTEAVLREYYGVTTTEIRADIKVADIQETLATGAVVLLPTDGRKLQNPNFHQPGPTTHMVVVIGYDAEKKEFITHDPGTRNGQNYRYKEDVLYGAIRDYPTGDHLPIVGVHKDMLVVRKP